MEKDTPYFVLFSFDNVEKEFDDFLNAYYPTKIITSPNGPITNLKPTIERTCRFCKRSHNEVKFDNDAHIIPEFLGNRYLISDFECDECNSRFGKYETDFSAWLGAVRTMLKTTGKNGIPTFKPFKEGISARVVDFFNNKTTKISDQSPSNDAIKINGDTGEVTIEFKKEAYIPLNVYKSFLKVALSIIDLNEVEDYNHAFNFLLNDEENSPFKSFAKVICHELAFDHVFERPCVILCKRIEENRKLPLHFFLLYYGNFIYGLPIPFNQPDINKKLYASGNIDVLFPPPILFKKPDEHCGFYNYFQDFSSVEKVKQEIQIMKLSLSPEIMKKATVFDPKTGEMKPSDINPSEIVGLYMVPAGTQIPAGMKFDLP